MDGDDEVGAGDEEADDVAAAAAAGGQAAEPGRAQSPSASPTAVGSLSSLQQPAGGPSKGAGAGHSASKTKVPMHKRNVHKPLLEPSKSPPRRALYDLRQEGLHLAIDAARSPASVTGADDGPGGGYDDGSVGWREEQAWGAASRRRGGDQLRQSPRRLGSGGAGRRGRLGGPIEEAVEEPGLLTPGQLKRAVDEAFVYLLSNDGAQVAAAEKGKDGAAEDGAVDEDEDEDESEEEPADSNSNSPSAAEAALNPQQQQKQQNALAETPAAALSTTTMAAASATTSSSSSSRSSSSPLSGVKLRARTAMAEAKEADAKLQCAQSLCEWAAHEGNVERLFTEGAADAVIRLSKEPQPLIRRYCARAFRRMSSHPLLAKELLAVGGIVQLLSRMVHPEKLENGHGQQRARLTSRSAAALGQQQHEQQLQQQSVPQQIVVDCLAALVNLTLLPDSEAQLVEDGIVPVLLKDREHYELSARALYNLTRVEAPYPFIDRVIKALVSLAASGVPPSVRQLCAMGLCHLAALKPLRLRLVEEGIVQVREADEKVYDPYIA